MRYQIIKVSDRGMLTRDIEHVALGSIRNIVRCYQHISDRFQSENAQKRSYHGIQTIVTQLSVLLGIITTYKPIGIQVTSSKMCTV